MSEIILSLNPLAREFVPKFLPPELQQSSHHQQMCIQPRQQRSLKQRRLQQQHHKQHLQRQRPLKERHLKHRPENEPNRVGFVSHPQRDYSSVLNKLDDMPCQSPKRISYLQAMLSQPEVTILQASKEHALQQNENIGDVELNSVRNKAIFVTTASPSAVAKLGTHWMELSRLQASKIYEQEHQEQSQMLTHDKSIPSNCSITEGSSSAKWFTALGPRVTAYEQQKISNELLINCAQVQSTEQSEIIAAASSITQSQQPDTASWWAAVWEADVPQIIAYIQTGFSWDCALDSVNCNRISHYFDSSINNSKYSKSSKGMNMLQLYVTEEKYSMALEQLLDRLPSLRASIDQRERRNINKRTLLHLACEARNADAVRVLVTRGASLTARDKSGDTPLHVAVRSGANNALVSYLCERSRQAVNMRNKQLEHPLMLAVRRDIALTLINAGANISSCNFDGFDVATLAAMTGNFGLLETIVLSNLGAGSSELPQQQLQRVRGGSKNLQQQCYTTPLHQTVMRQSVRGVELLLSSERYAENLNTLDRPNFYTPLMYAAETGNSEIFLLLLLHYGADPAVEDLNGRTALAIAAVQQNSCFIKKVAIEILAVNMNLARSLFGHINFRGESLLHIVADGTGGDSNIESKVNAIVSLIHAGTPLDGKFCGQLLSAPMQHLLRDVLHVFDSSLQQWRSLLKKRYLTGASALAISSAEEDVNSQQSGDYDVRISLENGCSTTYTHSHLLLQRGGAISVMLTSQLGVGSICQAPETGFSLYQLDFPHIDRSTFEMLLHWMRDGSLDATLCCLNTTLVADVLYTANELLLHELQFECEVELSRRLQSLLPSDESEADFTVANAQKLIEIVDAKFLRAYLSHITLKEYRSSQFDRSSKTGQTIGSRSSIGDNCSIASNSITVQQQMINYLLRLTLLAHRQLIDEEFVQLAAVVITDHQHQLFAALDGVCLSVEVLTSVPGNRPHHPSGGGTQLQRACARLLEELKVFIAALGAMENSDIVATHFHSWLLLSLQQLMQPSAALFRQHNASFNLHETVQSRLVLQLATRTQQMQQLQEQPAFTTTSAAVRQLVNRQATTFALWTDRHFGASDVLVTLSGTIASTTWRCHRNVLSFRCPKFAAMISFVEAQQQQQVQFLECKSAEDREENLLHLELSNISVAAVEALLTYIYTGTLTKVAVAANSGRVECSDWELQLELMRVGDEYLIENLAIEAGSLLLTQLDSTNALKLFCTLEGTTSHRYVLLVVALFVLKECAVLHRPHCKPVPGPGENSNLLVNAEQNELGLAISSAILLQTDELEYNKLMRNVLHYLITIDDDDEI